MVGMHVSAEGEPTATAGRGWCLVESLATDTMGC